MFNKFKEVVKFLKEDKLGRAIAVGLLGVLLVFAAKSETNIDDELVCASAEYLDSNLEECVKLKGE